MESLPNEVMVKICSRLSVEDILSLSEVNKSFNKLCYTIDVWKNLIEWKYHDRSGIPDGLETARYNGIDPRLDFIRKYTEMRAYEKISAKKIYMIFDLNSGMIRKHFVAIASNKDEFMRELMIFYKVSNLSEYLMNAISKILRMEPSIKPEILLDLLWEESHLRMLIYPIDSIVI